jgi:hypothetical protein
VLSNQVPRASKASSYRKFWRFNHWFLIHCASSPAIAAGDLRLLRSRHSTFVASYRSFNFRHLSSILMRDIHPTLLIDPFLSVSPTPCVVLAGGQLLFRATPLLEGAVSGYITVDQPMQWSSHQAVTPGKGRRLSEFPHCRADCSTVQLTSYKPRS